MREETQEMTNISKGIRRTPIRMFSDEDVVIYIFVIYTKSECGCGGHHDDIHGGVNSYSILFGYY